ncbi:hypothetical protein V2L60_14795, partial [Staphylococcus gallinarum]
VRSLERADRFAGTGAERAVGFEWRSICIRQPETDKRLLELANLRASIAFLQRTERRGHALAVYRTVRSIPERFRAQKCAVRVAQLVMDMLCIL